MKDFIEIGDLFEVKDDLYLCSAVVHDSKIVYGYYFFDLFNNSKEHKVKFDDVDFIYEKRKPNYL